jgi:hypothetical protein
VEGNGISSGQPFESSFTGASSGFSGAVQTMTGAGDSRSLDAIMIGTATIWSLVFEEKWPTL